MCWGSYPVSETITSCIEALKKIILKFNIKSVELLLMKQLIMNVISSLGFWC